VVDGVLAGTPLAVPTRGVAGLRLAVPQTVLLDAMDSHVAATWQATLTRLSQAGVQLVELPLAELAEVSQINAPGGFSAVEAYAVHRDTLRTQAHRFDPRVASRLKQGEGVSAADYITMQQRRRGWITRVTQRLAGFDAMLCPTVPIVAPPLAELVASDDAFFKANSLLLRNTFAVNFMDGCSFTLPCHAPGTLPVGLMLSAPAMHDAALAAVALAIEALLQA
jgi:aspartyl-tRNA(Asn)/glutamyl-tRNA(Gln) amidotransferase subunit A